MKKIRLLALLILGMAANVAFAQNIRVSGTVLSGEDGKPLPGVTVFVKGTTNGGGSDVDGKYTINNVPSNGTLEFRYVGFKTTSVPVNGKTKIDVTLASDALQAETVTVTAMGVKKQDRKLGYATTTVKGDELARTNAINPINALQGKVAGVQISSLGAGGVTSNPMILIRGAKSLSAGRTSPIFVIDGIIMENQVDEGWATSGGYGSQLKNLNPDEYESITVLKGAAATSIYGSRGSNGAIVITSKGGKVRKGIGLEASYTHEFSQVYAAPMQLQNEFGAGSPFNGAEGGFIDGTKSVAAGYTRWSYGPKPDGRPWQAYLNMPENPEVPYVNYKDNWKAYFQNGSYDRATIALTGGSDKATFRLSYGYTKQKGAMVNNSFASHSINFRTEGRLNDVFSTNLSVIYTNSKAMNRTSQGAWQFGNNYAMLLGYYMSRSTDLQWYKENYITNADTWTKMPTQSGSLDNVRNPFESANNNNEENNEQTLIAQLGLNAQFTKWLDASVSVSYNNWNTFTETKNYGGGMYRAGGYYAIAGGNSGSWRGVAQIHSNNTFVNDELELDIRLMAEGYGDTRSNYYQKNTDGGLITPGLFTFANSVNPIKENNMSWGNGPSTTPRTNMVIGVAAIVNLSWRNQINLELTARNDWVSSLLYPKWLPQGANNYSVFYPSVNVSWVFSDTFHINPNVVSFGKIRASFAQVGSGTGAYVTANGAGGFGLGPKQTPTGGSIYSANPNNNQLPNFDLKPEIQQSLEFGADVRFLNDRIGIDVAWYKNNTFNQILNLATVGESGVSSRWFNAGNIQNQGWEVALDFTPIRSREVRWNININFTRNRNKLVELGEGMRSYELAGVIDGSPKVMAYEGGAFGEVVAGGIAGGGGAFAPYIDYENPNNPLNGKQAIYDYTQGGVHTALLLQGADIDNVSGGKYYGKTQDDEHPYDSFGNIQPDAMLGLSTSLSYKGFNLFVQMDGRIGGTVIGAARAYSVGQGATTETLPGRSADHGGVARHNYKGDITYDGMILDGVYAYKQQITSLATGKKIDIQGKTMEELVKAGHMEPILSSAFYASNWGWGNADMCSKGTWFTLREITLSYDFPEKWIKHIGMQSAQLSFSARNVCYIYNGLKGKSNPEAITVNSPFKPYDMGGAPFQRSFALSLNVRF